jgi:hypothetical protein
MYAYRKACEREPGLETGGSIEIAGTGPGVGAAQKLARKLGLNLRVHGSVQRAQADELVGRADLLVVVQTETASRFQVPGKLFDYIAGKTPILAIMPECEAAEIARNSGLGFVHQPQDVHGMAQTLVALWSDWHEGRPSVAVAPEYVSQFSVRSLPNRLQSLLKGLQ